MWAGAGGWGCSWCKLVGWELVCGTRGGDDGACNGGEGSEKEDEYQLHTIVGLRDPL